MVLERLDYGASRLLSVDEGTRKLIFILCLPLIDGVFATLLVTGALNTFYNVLSVALTVFAGAGSLAVLYSYSESRKEALKMVGKVAPVFLVGVLAVSLIAPIYEQIINLDRMKFTAGIVLLFIARDITEVDLLKSISAEAVLVTGFILSLSRPSSLAFSFEYVLPALLTCSVAILGLLLASLLGSNNLRMDYIRRGAALVLVLISASMLGIGIPSEIALAVFCVSLVASHQSLKFSEPRI